MVLLKIFCALSLLFEAIALAYFRVSSKIKTKEEQRQEDIEQIIYLEEYSKTKM